MTTTIPTREATAADRPRSDTISGAARPAHTLDSLAMLSIEQLTELYAQGWVPETLAALDGTPTCRVLAAVGPLGRRRIAAALRDLTGSRRFLWAGKRFAATSDEAGTGINRLRLAGIREWFPFDMRFELSAVDGRACIALDYNRPDNPWFVRRIRDELRQVADALYVGPALWRWQRSTALLIYFACDHSRRYSPSP